MPVLTHPRSSKPCALRQLAPALCFGQHRIPERLRCSRPGFGPLHQEALDDPRIGQRTIEFGIHVRRDLLRGAGRHPQAEPGIAVEPGQRGIRYQHLGNVHRHPDRHEIAMRLEGHLQAQRRIDRQRARSAEREGVAVRIRLRAVSGEAGLRVRFTLRCPMSLLGHERQGRWPGESCRASVIVVAQLGLKGLCLS